MTPAPDPQAELVGHDTLAPYEAAGVLGPTERHVVHSVARASGHDEPLVLLALALAVRGPLRGHSCVDLATVADTVVTEDAARPAERRADGETTEAPAPVELPWPDPAAGWLDLVAASPLARTVAPGTAGEAADPTDATPLVVDGGRLYLDRYWRHERDVARTLRERAARAPGAGAGADDRAAVEAALDRFFGPDADDAQRRAAAAALDADLTVVAGGPGTGKTRTIARLLAVLQSLHRSGAPLEVALAAPTGKAAARMTEAVRQEIAAAGLTGEAAADLAGVEATTIHRLIGARLDGTARHDRSSPLSADVVVVDETSMVSLPLMAQLLDAVRPDARLVLVGDPDQLASVEVGAVLGDLVGTGQGDRPPAALAARVHRLTRRHRFEEASPVAHLADALRAGDADEALGLLRDADALALVDPDDEPGVAEQLDVAVVHAGALVDASGRDPAEALALLDRRRTLSATRRGRLGARWWNDHVERALLDRGLVPDPRWHVGLPLIAGANDHLNRVFNGDTGVVVEHQGHRRIALAAPGGTPRLLEPVRLGHADPLWAMTIHRSQGSEFDEVVVCLPPPPSPILTRELLYTAVTRARTRVTIVATEAAVRAAVDRPVSRASGLARRLDGPGDPQA